MNIIIVKGNILAENLIIVSSVMVETLHMIVVSVALKFVVPDYDLEMSEERNIQLGIDEVFNRWSDQEAACNATAETVKSYEECFVDVNKVLND